MPSGYTDQIKIDTPFPQWAMACARAFGALVLMRDDPLDAPIPQELQPNTKWSDEHIAQAQTRLSVLADATDEQLTAEIVQKNAELAKARAESVARDKETRAKYERMLAMVRRWTPPTPDHDELKRFMQNQITESIRFDCHDDSEHLDEWYPQFTGTPQEWRERELAKCHKDLAYHRQQRQEELERTRQRNAWIKSLRESLPAA